MGEATVVNPWPLGAEAKGLFGPLAPELFAKLEAGSVLSISGWVIEPMVTPMEPLKFAWAMPAKMGAKSCARR